MSDNWKNILIPKAASIKEALKIIDAEGLRIGMIVDDTDHLLGVVTDGDIRRAYLSSTLIRVLLLLDTLSMNIGWILVRQLTFIEHR